MLKVASIVERGQSLKLTLILLIENRLLGPNLIKRKFSGVLLWVMYIRVI